MEGTSGAIFAWFLLYLIFQVGIGTFVRTLDQSGGFGYLSRRRYLILLIPGIGVLFTVVWVLKSAFKPDK